MCIPKRWSIAFSAKRAPVQCGELVAGLAGQKLLAENPAIGRLISAGGVRELVIARTTFSFLYQITSGRIQVLGIWNGRANRAALGFR
jgi:hypothetical protein